MGLIEILVTLVIVGVVLWLVETVIPMDAAIKRIIQVVVILFVCIWLLQSMGLIGHMGGYNHSGDIRVN